MGPDGWNPDLERERAMGPPQSGATGCLREAEFLQADGASQPRNSTMPIA
jgi:hypothetical protein